MDKRKFNGNKGHSTSSKKAFDRRKRISVSDNNSFDEFFESMKDNMRFFYESTYKGFLDKHIRHGNYYVYFHYLNDEVVYIGKGTKERIFNHTSRTLENHSILMKNGKIDEIIVANNLTNEMSLLIESSLIKELNPKFNLKT